MPGNSLALYSQRNTPNSRSAKRMSKPAPSSLTVKVAAPRSPSAASRRSWATVVPNDSSVPNGESSAAAVFKSAAAEPKMGLVPDPTAHP